jgi:hypothetical protein
MNVQRALWQEPARFKPTSPSPQPPSVFFRQSRVTWKLPLYNFPSTPIFFFFHCRHNSPTTPYFPFLFRDSLSGDRLASIVFLFEPGFLPNIDDAAPRLPLSRFSCSYLGSSPFFLLLRGRFSSFCGGPSEISLSRVALPDRSSQTNPVVLGFSAAGSVRESVLLCALPGQTRLSCNAKQPTGQFPIEIYFCPHGEDPKQQQVRRRAIG